MNKEITHRKKRESKKGKRMRYHNFVNIKGIIKKSLVMTVKIQNV